MQDGSPSVAEQIAGQVEAIRAELNARHDERVQQLETNYNKRTENMRTLLNTKLREGKEAFRESVRNEHAQALEILNTQHQEQFQALQTRHQEEIDELKRNENVRLEQVKKDWATEHPSAPVTNGSSASKSEAQMDPLKASWNPSEAEIKDLVAHNEIVKSMVKRNIISVLAKEREKLTSQVKEEQQEILTKALAEADKKAKTATEQAVLMEGKRHGVKLSMTENRARGALAKVEYVEKAATETPQTPVVEVWEIAKSVKPPSMTPQQPQQGLPKGQNSPQSTTFGKPSSTALNQNPLQTSTFGKPSSTIPTQSSLQATTFGKPSSTVSASLSQGSFGQPIPVQGQMPPPSDPNSNQQRPNQSVPVSPTQTQLPSPKNEGSLSIQQNKDTSENLQSSAQAEPPQKATENPFQLRQNNNAGTGPAALRSLGAQSSLPLPSAGRGAFTQFNANQYQGNPGFYSQQSSRGGSNIGRGRGRGSGRGGLPAVATTGIPQLGQGKQGSPTGPLLSANAKQFVPQGNKRPREESQDSGAETNGGKRIRGEGGQDDG